MEENLISIYRKMREDIKKEDIMMMHPLKLAFIGDAIYELIVRTHILSLNTNLKNLHKIKVNLVNAKAQTRLLTVIEPNLNEVELEIVRRGRNTKAKTIPKNQSVSDYRHATALEALLGYLFLSYKEDRIMELMKKGLELNVES